MSRQIKVTYDGGYPSACSGRLVIVVGDKVVYDKKYRCHSDGGCWIDDNGDENVTEGALTWDDAEQFDEEIRQAVADVLSGVSVCCGGCI